MATLPIGELGLGNDLYDDNNAASLGRISGPLLKSNLERNGINLAVETDLLYFDVTNNRIGIRTDNPQYDLDVNSEIKTIDLDIGEQATIVDVLISRPNTFGTLVGPLEIRAGVDPTFTHGILETSDLRFEQNIISSFSNADIVFSSNGTGTVELLKSTQIIGTLAVFGNINVDGNLTAGDNIVVGDSPLDVASIFPELSSDLIPSANRFYNLGGSDSRWRDLYTTNIEGPDSISIANILISAPASISSTVGSLFVSATGVTLESFFEEIKTTKLSINDNAIRVIESNTNLLFDTTGTGTIELQSSTEITGNLRVTGNITLDGDLRPDGDVIIGDQKLDTVTINTDFTQSIIPGQDNTYDIGQDANDSSPRRWNTLISNGWETIGTIYPEAVTVNSQLLINGVTNKISALQLNQDVVLAPDTGITIIERTQWQDDTITNLNNTPITLANTGIGYYKIGDTNGVVIPAGNNSQRLASPATGATRWNTQNPINQFLECYDGTVWGPAIGGGEDGEITVADMEDFITIYSLVLG